MPKFKIKRRGHTGSDIEVEAAAYVQEGEFFVFYNDWDAATTKGHAGRKRLTLAAGDVTRIDTVDEAK